MAEVGGHLAIPTVIPREAERKTCLTPRIGVGSGGKLGASPQHSQCADSYSGFCTRHGTFIKGTTQTPLDKRETYSSRGCQLAEGDTENLLFLVSHPGIAGGQEAIWLEHAVNKIPRFKALCDL